MIIVTQKYHTEELITHGKVCRKQRKASISFVPTNHIYINTYDVCTHNGTNSSWRHIFEVIWGHLGTFEGSQLIRLIVVIIEDGGKSGDAPIILEPRMTPRPRLSRLVAHLRNPMRSKTLSRRVTHNPFTRSDLVGSDLRSDDCSAAP